MTPAGEAAMQHRGSGGRRNGSIYVPSEGVMPCSCSLLQNVDCGPGTFSIFFAASGIHEQPPEEDRDPYYGDAHATAVDCTLSLGTPSTRHQSHTTAKASPLLSTIQNQRRANKTMPWDLMASGQKKQTPAAASVGGATSVFRAAGAGGLKLGGDQLLARRCANCDTTSTPLWRNGPRGPKSLCNACGIRYKKEERRAAGSTAATLPSTSSCSSSSAISTASHLEPPLAQQQQHLTACYDYYQNPWYYPAALQATARKAATTPTFISAISGAADVDGISTMDGAAALPLLSWRLNMSAAPHAAEFVPSLVHDCT